MEFITVATLKSTIKRVRILEFEKTARARKGIQIIRDVKTNPYKIAKALIISNRSKIGIKYANEIDLMKVTEAPILDRYSTGTVISKNRLITIFEEKTLTSKDSAEKVEEIFAHKNPDVDSNEEIEHFISSLVLAL